MFKDTNKRSIVKGISRRIVATTTTILIVYFFFDRLDLAIAAGMIETVLKVGLADIYPRLVPTMEWDTAAADAIVRESGKMTYQFENDKPIIYNKRDLLNPWFVVK